jgi:hypothetical protein
MVPRGGWFKLQTDITEDPEVRKLDAEAFRVYVSILCILRQREYVAGNLLVPLETLIYHSGLKKEAILVRLRDIGRTKLGAAEYLKRTQEVRLNFPKWLDHQWEWIRKLRNFSGMSPEEVRRFVANEAPRLDEMRRDESERPLKPGRRVQAESPAPAAEDIDYKKDSILAKIANPLDATNLEAAKDHLEEGVS